MNLYFTHEYNELHILGKIKVQPWAPRSTSHSSRQPLRACCADVLSPAPSALLVHARLSIQCGVAMP